MYDNEAELSNADIEALNNAVIGEEVELHDCTVIVVVKNNPPSNCCSGMSCALYKYKCASVCCKDRHFGFVN